MMITHADIEEALLKLVPKQMTNVFGVMVQRLPDEDFECQIDEDRGDWAYRPRYRIGDSEPMLLLPAIDCLMRLTGHRPAKESA